MSCDRCSFPYSLCRCMALLERFSVLEPVEAAIRQSLSQSGKPALLLTDDGETHAGYLRELAGVCDDQGPTAHDGTSRFHWSDGNGQRWDVRLRLERPRRPNGHTPDAKAQTELRQAIQAYMAEQTTQAATALVVALVTADQARSDAVDLTRAPSEAP